MDQNNEERVKKNLPPYDLTSESAKDDPKLWGEQTVLDYELLQVRWFWGETPEQPPHQIVDRDAIAREMMQIANKYDQTEEYNWTKSMRSY